MLFSDIIIGGDKAPVIDNIRKHIKEGEFNKKAELDDPVLSDEDADELMKLIKENMNGGKCWTAYSLNFFRCPSPEA